MIRGSGFVSRGSTKRAVLFLLILINQTDSSCAQDPAPRPRQPFEITAFTESQPDRKLRTANLGYPHFAVQFKIKDPFLADLERAVVYLFDERNQLIHTMANTDPEAFRPRTETRQKGITIAYPNVIVSPEDLKADMIYTLIFRHMLAPASTREVRTLKAVFPWKYAVAVIGADDVYVYKVLPTWKKIEELDFPEKSYQPFLL